MNKQLEQFAQRKQVLQARSALHRLELQGELHLIGQDLRKWGGAARSVTPGSIASWLFGMALRSLAGGIVGRGLALTSGALMLLKLVRIGIGLVGRPKGATGPSESAESPDAAGH